MEVDGERTCQNQIARKRVTSEEGGGRGGGKRGKKKVGEDGGGVDSSYGRRGIERRFKY